MKINDRGESFYQSRMIDVVQELQSKSKNEENIPWIQPHWSISGLLKLEEGRYVMFLPDIEVPMTIVKSDGSFTYDTSDMATIKQRLVEENADWIIYVIDSGQVSSVTSTLDRKTSPCFSSGSAHAVDLCWSEISRLE